MKLFLMVILIVTLAFSLVARGNCAGVDCEVNFGGENICNSSHI